MSEVEPPETEATETAWEQVRTILIADLKNVGETSVGEQRRLGAAPL
jgi:hypothetical protein